MYKEFIEQIIIIISQYDIAWNSVAYTRQHSSQDTRISILS